MQIPSWAVLNLYTGLLIILLLIFQKGTANNDRAKRYNELLYTVFGLLVSATLAKHGEQVGMTWVSSIGNYFIYAFDPMAYLCAIRYMDVWMSGEEKKRHHLIIRPYQIFTLANFTLVTISLMFHLKWFYYFQDGVYTRGPLYTIRAVFMLIFCLGLMLYAAVFRRCTARPYRFALFMLPTISLLGVAGQMLFRGLNMTYAAITIGCLLLYFYLQGRDVTLDYLTGADNRRNLDMKLDHEIEIAIRGVTFSGIMIDIDRFKQINDTYGHDIGDQALKTTAEILMDALGENDSLGRYGGDEFFILSHAIDPRILDSQVEGIRAHIERWNAQTHEPYRLSLSMGYDVYKSDSHVPARDFIAHLDELMYQEKLEHHKILDKELTK